MLRGVFAILGFAAVAGAAVAQSVYGPDEVGARRLCVHTASLHDLVGLPGVRLVLERDRDVIDGTSPALPPCDRDGSSCGAFEVRTGARSEACFEGVPPGDYFVSALLEDYCPTRTGPIQVPVADFDDVQLRIGMDVGWSYRYATFLVGESPELGRVRPFTGPGTFSGKASAASARSICIAVWKTNELEELPGIGVTLEPWPGASSSAEPNPSGGVRAAPLSAWTGDRGVACFPGVAPGRYLARATLDGFWDSAVGPIEVPVEDFDVRDVRVGIDVQWAVDDIANLCEGFTWL